MNKKVVFSAVQPSGELTIGNYIGAIRNFAALQEDMDCYFAIADLHSITVNQIPKNLRERTLKLLALYIAMGMDPKKSTIFIQSHVSTHAELTWVLNCIAYMGQLSRMTQYKDKSQKSEENLNAGLFTYPVLMAADILLYQTDLVPIGEDQKQHLELARDLAIRFNNKYSETFKVPEALMAKEGIGRIRSLKDPESKMSKSDEDNNASVFLLDDKDTIIRKIKRAVTDSEANFDYNDNQKGLKNLINIYNAFSNESIENIIAKYKTQSYSVFKEDLGFLVADKLGEIQNEFNHLMSDKKYLENIYREGAEKASYQSYKTLRKVYKKVGFVPR